MKKINFEELIEIPYNVIKLLLEIKEAEEKNKSRLNDYHFYEDSIKEEYKLLKDLIKRLNKEK